MQLTAEELAALDMLRSGQASLNQSWLLADAMLRLFPVRTYGTETIRWDDPVTPVGLLATGFFKDQFWPDDKSSTRMVIVSHDEHNRSRYMKFKMHQSVTGGEYDRITPGTATVEIHGNGVWIAPQLQPRNMLEVWQLMERCGIDSHAPKETT